jgi:(S)-2-hydroxyglutarate dehydrogenase
LSIKILQKRSYDYAIIGGGILGVSIAYWISSMYDCSLVIVDKENRVGMHTSSRNTGVVHRPFYINPEKKKIFAGAAQKSYSMWKDVALEYNLPWTPVGTLEVATSEDQVKTLESYMKWSEKNGIQDEVELLDARAVRELEPEVKCAGAIFSKNDTAVSYGDLTNFVFERAQKNGAKLMGNSRVVGIDSENNLRVKSQETISANFIINAAGGGSVEIAHLLGLGKEYTDLFFRGEYWRVQEPFASRVKRNIYSVPRYKEFPFLDPHYIIRANGTREIGPNAVLVFGSGAYKGVAESKSQLLTKPFESPLMPKLKLFTNKTFLSLIWHEWRSSISKEAMCERVKGFIPSIDSSFLDERGLAGIRASVIDANGFVPEALLLQGERSLHILNFNSPGATGAPAFSAYVVSKLIDQGRFDGKKTLTSRPMWDFDQASSLD